MASASGGWARLEANDVGQSDNALQIIDENVDDGLALGENRALEANRCGRSLVLALSVNLLRG